jgi:hypothetical protein
MLTAIYVSELASITIAVNESDLELTQLSSNTPIPLPNSTNTLQLGRGIYKLVSTNSVSVTGNQSVLVESAINPKSGYPQQSPRFVADSFTGISTETLQSFFAVADGRSLKAQSHA